jgi:HEPN domain-containing protein
MKDAAELCRGLVRKAQSDRAAMDASLAAKVFDAACFHAQQVAEKCLKAFLAHRGVMFPYTHNLTKLVEMSVGIDAIFRSLLPVVAPLTPYAVELRYDDSFWPSEDVAEEARSSALAVLRFVLERLPADIGASENGT